METFSHLTFLGLSTLEKPFFSHSRSDQLLYQNTIFEHFRYFAERKLKWLEPELKKWKDQHETLKKFRKVQLNKSANAKMAKLKRNTRRYAV